MEELIGGARTVLDATGELTEILLNALSLVVIAAGVVLSLRKSIRERRRVPGEHPRHTGFRLFFSGWLVVALEFQLAADIVSTFISPTPETLIKLAAVALIRTFLNYFLVKELKEEAEAVRLARGIPEKPAE